MTAPDPPFLHLISVELGIIKSFEYYHEETIISVMGFERVNITMCY